MKKLILKLNWWFIIIVLCGLLISHYVYAFNPLIVCSGAGAVVESYLINQNFEGTGYDNDETWTNPLGSIDPDYTTTVLLGSQSLQIAGAYGRCKSPSFSVSGFCSLHFMLRLPSTSATTLIGIDNSSSTEIINMIYDGTRIYLSVNEGYSGITVNISSATTYHVWIDITTGTGADGIIEMYVSETATKPASPSSSSSTQGNTTDPHTVTLVSTNADNLAIFDQVIVDDEEIGDL